MTEERKEELALPGIVAVVIAAFVLGIAVGQFWAAEQEQNRIELCQRTGEFCGYSPATRGEQ